MYSWLVSILQWLLILSVRKCFFVDSKTATEQNKNILWYDERHCLGRSTIYKGLSQQIYCCLFISVADPESNCQAGSGSVFDIQIRIQQVKRSYNKSTCFFFNGTSTFLVKNKKFPDNFCYCLLEDVFSLDPEPDCKKILGPVPNLNHWMAY